MRAPYGMMAWHASTQALTYPWPRLLRGGRRRLLLLLLLLLLPPLRRHPAIVSIVVRRAKHGWRRLLPVRCCEGLGGTESVWMGKGCIIPAWGRSPERAWRSMQS